MDSLFDLSARAFLDRRNVNAVRALAWPRIPKLRQEHAVPALLALLRHNRGARPHTRRAVLAGAWNNLHFTGRADRAGAEHAAVESCVDPVVTLLLAAGPRIYGAALGAQPGLERYEHASHS